MEFIRTLKLQSTISAASIHHVFLYQFHMYIHAHAHTGSSHDYSQQARDGCCSIRRPSLFLWRLQVTWAPQHPQLFRDCPFWLQHLHSASGKYLWSWWTLNAFQLGWTLFLPADTVLVSPHSRRPFCFLTRFHFRVNEKDDIKNHSRGREERLWLKDKHALPEDRVGFPASRPGCSPLPVISSYMMPASSSGLCGNLHILGILTQIKVKSKSLKKKKRPIRQGYACVHVNIPREKSDIGKVLGDFTRWQSLVCRSLSWIRGMLN